MDARTGILLTAGVSYRQLLDLTRKEAAEGFELSH
jgi:hypothetical protein